MNYGDLFISDKEGLDLLSAPDEFELSSLNVITITHELVGKPWVIAQLQYSDFRLWWAIAKANNVRIPMIMRDTFRIRTGKPNVDNIITDLYLGRVIVIPSLRDINNYVNLVTRNR
jgi:hypothetical protein